jgi:hypothetical protein
VPNIVDMQVAGLAEDRIFEVMVFQIGEAVRHVRLTRQEGLFPDHLVLAQDTAVAAQILGQGADQNLRAEGGHPQLGMGEPEVVDPFGHMVGEFVAQGPADPVRGAVGADQVDAGDFGLLAAVFGKTRGFQRGAGATAAWPLPL